MRGTQRTEGTHLPRGAERACIATARRCALYRWEHSEANAARDMSVPYQLQHLFVTLQANVRTLATRASWIAYAY